MAIPDPMTKAPESGIPAKRATSQNDRRGSRRCKITQLMRIRPSDPEKEHFDDMRGTTSVSRSGVYFQTTEPGYEVGMRLFVTMPFSSAPTAMNREYLAEVVRKDELTNGMSGIGLKILMEMGTQHSYSFTPPSPSK
jgi:PilZ domain